MHGGTRAENKHVGVTFRMHFKVLYFIKVWILPYLWYTFDFIYFSYVIPVKTYDSQNLSVMEILNGNMEIHRQINDQIFTCPYTLEYK